MLPLAPIDFPSCMCIFFPLFCFGSNCWNSLLAAYCMWYTSLYNYNMENIRLYLLYCVMSSRDWFETYLLMHLMYSSVMFTPNWKLILKVSKQIGKLLSIQTYHFFKWKKKHFRCIKFMHFFGSSWTSPLELPFIYSTYERLLIYTLTEMCRSGQIYRYLSPWYTLLSFFSHSRMDKSKMDILEI